MVLNDFCIFFKKISILNALHIFSDEIFFNVPHQLQAFYFVQILSILLTRIIGLQLQVRTVLSKSTNLKVAQK